jgi:hypothetical protein
MNKLTIQVKVGGLPHMLPAAAAPIEKQVAFI